MSRTISRVLLVVIIIVLAFMGWHRAMTIGDFVIFTLLIRLRDTYAQDAYYADLDDKLNKKFPSRVKAGSSSS